MSALAPEIVNDAHGYTREDVPWDLCEATSPRGRLVQYLASGGMHIFGRTIAQQKARCRHRRCLLILLLSASLWTIFYFL